MSFILDALRKSEHERQRRVGPAIADLSVAPRRSSVMPVLVGIGVLLLVNLAAVAYFMLRENPPATPAAVAPAGPMAVAPPAPVASAAPAAATPVQAAAIPSPAGPAVAVEPSRAVRPLAAEAVPAAAAPAPDATPPPPPDPLLLPAAPRPAAAPPAAAGASRAAASADFVPRLDALPAQATAGLPVLNLDLHIYSGDPSQRAVFINGRRYREGDALPEGLSVVSITPEGVVLRYRGQQFLLARQ